MENKSDLLFYFLKIATMTESKIYQPISNANAFNWKIASIIAQPIKNRNWI